MKGTFLCCAWWAMAVAAAAESPAPFAPVIVTDQGIRLTPETERHMRRVIIGLPCPQERYFMLSQPLPGGATPQTGQLEWMREQYYWLAWELQHGRIVEAVPDITHFYIAVAPPVPGVPASANARRYFENYLRQRAGWTDKMVRERLSYFPVSEELDYPQDIGQPVGRDKPGRLVLALGGGLKPFYREISTALVKAFPSDFSLYSMPEIDTEGGDLQLCRSPEGRLLLLVGYHRVLGLINGRHPETKQGAAIRPEWIESIRKNYSRAFFGIEVLIVGEEALLDPRLQNEDLFHTDMVVSVIRSEKRVTAFVPHYLSRPVDAVTHVPLLDEQWKKSAQFFDRVARQMEKRGFPVVRLPFADHPVRNPVNTGKFVDLKTGESCILLGRYPYHFALKPGGEIPQFTLQEAFDRLEAAVTEWLKTPADGSWKKARQSVRDTWAQMDASVQASNPTFEEQAALYRQHGIRVIPVPIYATGEGGLHCSMLK